MIAPTLPLPPGSGNAGNGGSGLVWPLRSGPGSEPARAPCGLLFRDAATAALHADGGPLRDGPCPRCTAAREEARR